MAKAQPAPSEQEVSGYFEKYSNWGRWGPDDNAGTINLITPEKRREAAALVQKGRTVSLARPLNTLGGPGNLNPAQHFFRAWSAGAVDYIGLIFHGYSTTHVDALCHIFWEGKMWNGRSSREVDSLGAHAGAVDAWRDGIVTRGVLLDIPRLRGAESIEQETPVRGYEMLAAAEAQGVTLQPGDAVLVYSGREQFFRRFPGSVPGVNPSAGLHADCIPVLAENDAAILGWDLLEYGPSGYSIFDDGRSAGGPIHNVGLVAMGLPLLDNALLEPLATACAEEGRWEFMLTIAPLNVPRGTGSPVNPIAVF